MWSAELLASFSVLVYEVLRDLCTGGNTCKHQLSHIVLNKRTESFAIFPLQDGENDFMSHPLCAEIPPCAVDPLYRCFLSVLLFSPTPLVDSRPPSRPSISIGTSLCVCCCSGRNAGGLVFPLSRSGWGSSAGVFFEFKSPFVPSCRVWGSALRTGLNQLNGYRGCMGKDPSIQRSDMFRYVI